MKGVLLSMMGVKDIRLRAFALKFIERQLKIINSLCSISLLLFQGTH
jgi:hypothetical protein